MNHPSWLTGCSKECYGFRGPPFPEKLFAAMDVPRAVIQWTSNGRAISVDSDNYERNVLDVHPGLVEISSFANFRRQMREYAFDWTYHPETREFEFSHPSFVRSRPELLPAVLTRRKRRRRHGDVARTRRQAAATPPCRRSVIAYAGSVKTDGDQPRPCTRPPPTKRDVGTARSLNDLTDDEWWTYCAPGIVSGMNGIKDELVRPTIVSTFSVPLSFYCDEPATENINEAISRTQDGLWTQRTLDFDEL